MTSNHYFRTALTKHQQRLAKRLSTIQPVEERLYDEEFRALDDTKPMAAFVVLAYADTLDEENHEHAATDAA